MANELIEGDLDYGSILEGAGCSLFQVGRKAMDNLADELFSGGMPWEAATEEAFDFFLRKAGDHIYRVGEVWLQSDYAFAQCVRLD